MEQDLNPSTTASFDALLDVARQVVTTRKMFSVDSMGSRALRAAAVFISPQSLLSMTISCFDKRSRTKLERLPSVSASGVTYFPTLSRTSWGVTQVWRSDTSWDRGLAGLRLNAVVERRTNKNAARTMKRSRCHRDGGCEDHLPRLRFIMVARRNNWFLSILERKSKFWEVFFFFNPTTT
jgi:hypothetical protein